MPGAMPVSRLSYDNLKFDVPRKAPAQVNDDALVVGAYFTHNLIESHYSETFDRFRNLTI